MRRFFIRLFIYALIMFVCDLAVGFAGNRLLQNSKDGHSWRQNYIANGVKADFLIFGSSRAVHHYDPNILKDSLGLTVYNCGFDGHGIICAYGFFKMITERYYPKVVVYEVTPRYDLLVNNNSQFLGPLRYFYEGGGKNSLDSIFWKVDKKELYKMASNMYRFNSVFPLLIMENIHPFHVFNKGYEPLDNEMKSEPKQLDDSHVYGYDSLKLYYMERLIKDCQGKTKLIFTISPFYENKDDKVLKPLKKMCEKYRIPFLNHFTDTTFNYRRKYFSDKEHLNRKGATAYSSVVANEIKTILNKRKCTNKK
ncbi:MAG: hypothetical protein LUC91_08330 [Prevotella sp.]|nr:hypothetical protein [Prevotella sp.]